MGFFDYFWFILFVQIFIDKAAKRAVLSLGVKCVNWKRKCDWTGDLIYVEVSDILYIYFKEMYFELGKRIQVYRRK